MFLYKVCPLFIMLLNFYRPYALASESERGFVPASNISKLKFNYKQLMSDPVLIMNLPEDQRKEAIRWVKNYRQEFEIFQSKKISEADQIVNNNKIVYENGVKQLTLAKESFNFFLNLKLNEEERILYYQLKKQEILRQQGEILEKLDEEENEFLNGYVEKNKRTRQEERSIFGYLKDSCWGRIILIESQHLSYKEKQEKIKELFLEKMGNLEEKMQWHTMQYNDYSDKYTVFQNQIQLLEKNLYQ